MMKVVYDFFNCFAVFIDNNKPPIMQIGGYFTINEYLILSACVAEGVHFFAVKADFKMEVRAC